MFLFQMKAEFPLFYNILTTQPIEYIEEGFDTHYRNDKKITFDFDMVARHKVFKYVVSMFRFSDTKIWQQQQQNVFRLDDAGNVIKVQFGNSMRSWFFDCDPQKVQTIYDALKCFTTLCYRPENQLIFRLNNGWSELSVFPPKNTLFLGETILWANTRLLHARSAYESTPDAERSLLGCYYLWDIVKSKIRLLRDQLPIVEKNQFSIWTNFRRGAKNVWRIRINHRIFVY